MSTESSISSIAENSGLYTNTSTIREPDQDLDKDAFLQLLVTQMRYQDPLNPMDNQEMMAQLAQFSALEQMQNVATASTKQLANAMLGTYVEYQYTDDTGTINVDIGKVEYVTMAGSEVLLGIGEREVSLDDVQKTIDAANIQADTSAFELMGQTVQGALTITNENGEEETQIIEGTVLQVLMEENTPYVILGTGDQKRQVTLSNVQNIIEKKGILDHYITANHIDEEGNTSVVEGIVEYTITSKDATELYLYNENIDEHYVVEYEDLITVE